MLEHLESLCKANPNMRLYRAIDRAKVLAKVYQLKRENAAHDKDMAEYGPMYRPAAKRIMQIFETAFKR